MEYWQLKQRQSLPLSAKIKLSEIRIRQFYDYFKGEVYISFSGGKDSTVLVKIVRNIYPNVPAVFVDTGLEYPEIREFVKTIENVIWLKPKMKFKEVLEKHGFPVISKQNAKLLGILQRNNIPQSSRERILRGGGRFQLPKKWQYLEKAPFKISEYCCNVMKKNPMKKYVKETGRFSMNGMMADESQLRIKGYLQYGCNAFDMKEPQSRPLMFWTEKDIWEYIRTENISYSKIYDMGLKRTGCYACMFGVHLEKGPNRFQLMQNTHPKLYDYCINNLGCGEVLDYIGVNYK